MSQPLVDGAVDHLLELLHQRRHEVHRQPDVAVLPEQLRDVEVAARAMQAHPGQQRATASGVDVLRLVHVEQEDDVRASCAHTN